MLALSLMAPAAIMEGKSDDIVILHTNDVHTYIDGELSYDVIAGVKAELEKTYNYVILADAGDAVQGTAFGSMDKGETIVKLMNAAGYDVATLGNHEFDYDMDGALNVIEWANYPYVSCNFYHEENNVRNENVLDSYVTFICGDMSVAFIGITTPESFTKSTPAYFQDDNGNYIYGIAGGEDGSKLYADVQAAIDEVKALGVDKVIALAHLGDDKASQPWTSEETILNTCGLDAFIDGHSHSTVLGKEVLDKDGHTVILNQTGEYFGKIGMMVIDSETGAISCDFITASEIVELATDSEGQEVENVVGYELSSNLYNGAKWPVNEEVKAIKDAWIDEINTKLGEVIGSTALTFNNYDAEGKRLVRSQETNTGDLAADALYWLFDEMGLDVDVAIMNGGGVRNKAVTGEISYLVAKQIHTFGNVACLQTITGQQLLDALEWGARFVDAGKENGGFLQVSGITYKIDSSYPESVVADDKGVWVSGPTAGYRVHSVEVYNKETGAYEPLDLAASYNLAGYNYTLRDLGDGFAMFDGAINVLDYVMEDYMVVSNYVSDFEGGVVEATNSPLLAKYPGMLLDYSTVNGSGRIVVAPMN
ncbi:MAG: bifunctional metallophosphatase/5'-nucleotidase [Clostridia bacterium]|nr:bifunctional metallophosphatase/5'-nucleotidase [Clostridia bacterium]